MLGFWARSVLIIWSEVRVGEGALWGCSSVPLWHLVRQTGAFKQLNLSDHSHQLMLVYYLSSSTAIMQSFDIQFYSHLLTLLQDGGGAYMPPCHVFAYICANTRTSVLKKLDFSQLWVWKRAVHFLPSKVISFRWEKKSSSEIPKFHKGGPLRIGSNAFLTNKSFKSLKLFWRVLGIQTSWILLYMVNNS